MIVRVRLRLAVGRRRLALLAGSLLTPMSVMAGGLAMWRLGSDMKWAGEFAISRGVFSHWQVWLVMALALELCAYGLNRYGRGDHEAMP